MKKIKLLLILVLTLVFTACSSNGSSNKTIKISCTPEPHATILEASKELFKEKGYELEIVVLDDYYVFNKALDLGEVDANYFQHVPFFNNEVSEKGYKITNLVGVHIEPFGFYSKTIKSVSELKENAKVVISNSVSDNGRILAILEKEGLIKIKSGVDVLDATLSDIAENKLNLQFVEVKPELLVTAYNNNEGDLVAINGNYAIGGGLKPSEDAVILEQADQTNPYVNIVAVKTSEKDSEKSKVLVEVFTSDALKQIIKDKYQDGSVIPTE